MDWKLFWFLLFFSLALSLAGLWCIFWVMKKAGIKPTGSFTKLFYDNVTAAQDTRTGRRRSWYCSKKGGKLSVEVAQTRGSLWLEFYTDDGQVLQRWQTGDPPVFTVALPPGARVYRRGELSQFSGSICFRSGGRLKEGL